MTAVAGSSNTLPLGDGAQTTLTQWGTHGPAIVCVHGMTSSRFSWTRFAERFCNRYRIFAYDQRGHGDSADILGPMTLQQGEADLHSVCKAIPGEIGALMGHSWGGAVVVRGGRTISVERVIAIDPLLYADPHIDWYEEYLADFDADRKLSPRDLEVEIRRRYAEFGWATEDIDAKLHAVSNMALESLLRLESENNVASGGWDVRKLLESYPKPLLIALADVLESTVTQSERDWLRGHGGPNVTTIEYPGLGHSLQRTHFERFVNHVDRWLTGS